ncbi:lanthionine synthetase LanC family protein [Algoriphagus sp. D3-2-R+10]|uniref:lanthionine synthetase LanC family protein n=1 Tax=Algoriphagus aurantiacus TaxID=3103948 RepID=UPI002B3FBDE5|nr:lanthionine synthetase LanC family protein [Algoriphagus sp. D3-2-R+10]MEB2774732.1 lanthionine synthetase LanC family protein [Algoriphagus sp. D3-2-R+10]
MKQALEKLHKINELLLENSKDENGLGLLNGKLGLSIYFYHLAKKTGTQEYMEAADNLVVEIFDKLSEAKLPADFENGLAGIAFGISYLVNSDFVEADLDDTLGDLDDRIFMFLEDQKGKLSSNLRNGLIGYLIYSLNRLETSLKSGHQSNTYIFHKLTSGLLNELGQLIEEEKLQDREPQLFNIFWDLPLALMVLAKAKNLKVNVYKVDRILDYLLPNLLSLFPSLHSNRLYLLLGIESVLGEINNAALKTHGVFLKKSIDIETIFNSECKNLNISVMDGASGLRLVGNKLGRISGDVSFFTSDEQVLAKINKAASWGENDFYVPFKKSIGLASGLSGVAWALLESLSNVGHLVVEKKSDSVTL